MDRPEGPFKDSVDRDIQMAKWRAAVMEEAERDMRTRVAVAQTSFSQDLRLEIDREVRASNRGRFDTEIEGEVEQLMNRESGALRQLSPREIEACRLLGVRPSGYAAGKPVEVADGNDS